MKLRPGLYKLVNQESGRAMDMNSASVIGASVIVSYSGRMTLNFHHSLFRILTLGCIVPQFKIRQFALHIGLSEGK